ncbi:MAG: protein tyrosine phosphatase family protein [Anaerolineales bacterium]|nr:protein tyrosine phosphatase family protein [Anaerolineales bacterium]
MSTQSIYNYRLVDDQLITGGQPTAEQLRAAAAEGVVLVINLATYSPGHSLEDEAGLVQSLGLAYIHIPVEWGRPRPEDFEAFERAMAARPAGKTLLHCAANFRVTAFYSLYAQKHLGWSVEQAEAFRASIWAGSDYPVWEQFIAALRAQIAGR